MYHWAIPFSKCTPPIDDIFLGDSPKHCMSKEVE